ncbi:MAG: hypothetical protein LIO77_06015 [Rikenellaceae bacterium]|nr:hypothetical protein [Rikenellaceae bacterium]
MKIRVKPILCFAISAILICCGTGGKTDDSKFTGRTYSDAKELGLTETFSISLSYDQVTEEFNRERISLAFMYEDPREQSNRGKHIFLVGHSGDTPVKTILAELDIDRQTEDIYDFALVNFTRDGQHLMREYLVRTDPHDESFREIYLVDLKNHSFIAREPYEDIEFEQARY